MKLVAVANQKGGVGKTTVAMQLGAALSRRERVLVADVDPQRSTEWWAENASDSLPFDFSVDHDPAALGRLRALSGDYDIAIVDTPGSLDDTRTLEAVLDIADLVIVPLPPESLAVAPSVRTISTLVEPRRLPHLVLLNRIDQRVPRQITDWQSLLDTTLGIPRFARYLRQYRAHVDAPMLGRLVTSTPDTRRTAGLIADVTSVAAELRQHLSDARHPED